jgi:polysaccharide biosynthesis protein PslE
MQNDASLLGEALPYPLTSVRDILTALFKHKIKIGTVFVVLFGLIALFIFSGVPLYQAKASLILKLGRENIFRPEVGQGNQTIVEFNKEAALQSELNIIMSKELVRQVVKHMGIEKLYPEFLDPELEILDPMEKGVGTFLGSLVAIPVKNSNVIEISYTNPNPEVAAEALNLLIEFLKERHLQIFSDPKASFLSQQLQVYEEKLAQSEESLQNYKRRHHLSSPPLELQGRLLNQRSELDSERKAVKNKLRGLEGKITSLDSQMKEILEGIPVATIEEGGNLEKAKEELFVLKREEQKLLTKYTETSHPVMNIRKEIEQLEQFILSEQKGERAKTVSGAKRSSYNQLEMERLKALSEITTFEQSSRVIDMQIQELDKQIQELDELNKELSGLERERAADEQNYKLYLTRVEEAKVSEEMNRLKMANISVIQPADVPKMPSGRSPMLLLIVGTVFSGGAAVGLGLVLEFFQGAYTRPEQASRDLKLPLLASFSEQS